MKKTVLNLQTIETVINNNESDIQYKIDLLEANMEKMMAKNKEIKGLTAEMNKELERTKKISINEKNVDDSIKPSNNLYEMWAKKEAKRRSLENCIQMIRKYYEDKLITLNMFIDTIGRLSTKQFKCLRLKLRFNKFENKNISQ